METASSPAGGFRGALARLRAAPLWVWITILLTFGLLIFAYLQYKKNGGERATTNAASNGTVPVDGSGQPLWNTADQGAFTTGNAPELAALLAYIQSQQTPNPPPVATPTIPTSIPPVPLRPVPLQPAPQVPARTTATNPTGTGYLPVRPILWGRL